MGSGFRLGIIASLACGSAGLNHKLIKIRLQSLFLCLGRLVPTPKRQFLLEDPNKRVLSLPCAPGAFVTHPPAPSTRINDHIDAVVYCLQALLLVLISGFLGPWESGFLIIPTLQRRTLGPPEDK